MEEDSEYKFTEEDMEMLKDIKDTLEELKERALLREKELKEIKQTLNKHGERQELQTELLDHLVKTLSTNGHGKGEIKEG